MLVLSHFKEYNKHSNNSDMSMIHKRGQKQLNLESINIEDMALKDHLLRMIDRIMDFGFVREKLYPLYCPALS